VAATVRSYTYRAGKRIDLVKDLHQFVVRARPEELRAAGITAVEAVSPSSSCVTTGAGDLDVAMDRARAVATTHHAYRDAETGSEFLITDRVLVTFRAGTPRAVVDALAARYGLVVKEAYSERDFLMQLTDHTGMNPVKLVVRLNEAESATVENAEHDLNHRMQTYVLPRPDDDPTYASQWHLHDRLKHTDFDPRSSTHCADAWRLLGSYGDPNVVVCVTDDGCRLDHADFWAAGKFAGWGYMRGSRLVTNTSIDADPRAMYQQGSNHGTSCNGVVAAAVNATLTVGGAPGCRLLPIKWELTGAFLSLTDSKLLTVLGYVADKVDVISNSWGGSPRSDWSLPVLERIRDLALRGGRRGRGIVFLWAAGNENCPISHTGTVDIPYTRGWEVKPDGSRVWVGVRTSRSFSNNLVGEHGVMHVAALSSIAQRSHYSNYGRGITLCAPTNNVHEYGRLSVRGLGIVTDTGDAPTAITSGFGGTSSATPLVAAVAALVISANPRLTAPEVVSVLKRTAFKNLDVSDYARTPPATYDPGPTWDVSPVAPFDSGAFRDGDSAGSWSPWFGHGRVDAAAAVTEALRVGGAAMGETRAPFEEQFRNAIVTGAREPLTEGER